VFSVLDIKQACHEIPIAQKSQGDLTINTHIDYLHSRDCQMAFTLAQLSSRG